jgi:hypothetical protein
MQKNGIFLHLIHHHRVCVVLDDGHILRGCAAGAQCNQGTGYESKDDARQYVGNAHAFFVLVVDIVSHKPMD